MRKFTAFSLFLLLSIGVMAQKPVHPVDLYECVGKNSKWVDRFIRSQYDIKAGREEMGQDTVRLHFYNSVSDVEVSVFLVDEVCEYVGFNDYSLDENGIKTYFTRWCSDVSDHYKFFSGNNEQYPMFEDEKSSMVFFIPDGQQSGEGVQYYMFAGFIRGEQLLGMN